MTTIEEIESCQNFLVTLDTCHGKDAQSRCFVIMLKEIINKHIQRLNKENNKTMKNIFENAYFGKLYKARDGRKAIYVRESAIDLNAILMVYENSVSLYRIQKDGRYWANMESDNDIVSEWEEE